MRNHILSLIIFVALPAGVFAGEAKILSLSGAVEVRPAREGQWTSASKDMEIPEGGGVRTGAGGGVVVQMPNKTKVWLKENTALEIEQRQTLASRLALVFGKIKVRVPHLMRKEKFEVRTPAAICAVRGTEFTMGTTQEGKMDLKVLFGEVKFKFNVPPAKGKAEFNIPQGQGLETRDDGKPSAPALLTAAAEREAMENWNPGLKADERQKGLIEKANDRAQIKDYAKTTASAENAVKNFLNVVKESDLEAGRTLKDVHGNTVRVDQRMMRPDSQTIQFFNLVKRPVYNHTYNSAYGFAYNGAQGIANRLDYMQMNMAFNTALPARIEEWPSFFSDDTIKPTYSSFVMANRTDANEIFFIAEGWKYDAARDELVNNIKVVDPSAVVNNTTDRDVIITGVLVDDSGSGISAVEGLSRIGRLEFTDDGVSNGAGSLVYTNGGATLGAGGGEVLWALRTANSGYSKSSDDLGGSQLWQYEADPYLTEGTGTQIWLARENYVIGNGGDIKNTEDFTNSSTDPFTLLKSMAAQTVMYIKNHDGTKNDALPGQQIMTTDRFGAITSKNIDLVFIPDLAVAAVQRMLPAISNLGD
jgi:hypothetical protein